MLSAEGDIAVDTASSGETALERMAGANYDAVVSDYKMPGLNGIDLLREARSRGFANIFVIFTARGGEDIALDAILNGADHYLPKSTKLSQDVALIRSILRKRQKQAADDKEAKSERSYRSLAMRMRDGFAYHRVIYDDGGTAVGSSIVDANDAFGSIVGLPREKILGKDLRSLLLDAEGYERRLREAFEEVMATGKEVTFEDRSHPTGRWLSASLYVPEPGHITTVLADLTAQKRAQEGDRVEMKYYLRLLEDLPTPIWFVDTVGRTVFLNHGWTRLTGRSATNGESAGWEESVHPDDREGVSREFQEAVQARRAFAVEHRIAGADGKEHIIISNGVPIFDLNGACLGILGFCFDITEKRELERLAKEGGSHYSAMFHGSHAVMLLIDGEDATIVDANQAASDFYGYPVDKLIGMSIDDISTKDASGIIRQTWSVNKNPETLLHRKHRLASGEVRDVDVYLALVDVNGRSRVLDLVFDVTERKIIEETLERERRDYEVVFNTAPTMMVIRDAEGRTIRCNKAFAERMGMTPEQAAGTSMFDLMPAFAKQFHEEDLDVMRTGQPRLGVETQYQTRSGERRWGYTDKLPYKNAEGVNIGVIVFTIDITRRKLIEEELELARKKLRLLGSITRHDLFNQITAINGYLGIAQMKTDSQMIKDYMSKAMKASEGMTKILDFSRDYEKMGSQRPEWCKAQEAALMGVSEAGMGETAVSVHLEGLEILADRMVQKVFHNLADNSVRHGRAANVRFFYERNGDDLKIVCEDDGRGVPPEKRASLFDDRFGHGLYMVKEVLKMTGLTISAAEVEKGTRFEILVPRERFRIVGPA